MSNEKLLVILVLVAIGRTSAFYRRHHRVSSANDENYRVQKFLDNEDEGDVLHYQPVGNSVSFPGDEDNEFRRILFISGDTEPRTEKIGAGITLFGIPFGAEIGYTKKRETKSASQPRTVELVKPVLVPMGTTLDEEEQEQPKGEQELFRVPAKKRMVITKQKIHAIKREHEPRRATFISHEHGRKSGEELSAGLELFGIPIGSKIVYDDDVDEEVFENDSDVKTRPRRADKYNVATKLVLE